MRITNKSVYINYLGQLENIQNNKFREEVRLNTGKQINNIEEAPNKLAEIKLLQHKITNNENYLANLQNSMSEMRTAMESMDTVANTLINLRQLTLDSIQVVNSSNPQTLAVQIKDLLSDIVSQANIDFNGKSLFSGTATTEKSVEIDPLGPLAPFQALSNNKLPYEIINVAATPANPSGLTVIFKGNNENRIINKDQNSSEIINLKSDELFGTGGTEPELFQDIIKIYNIIKFKPDGSLRTETDFYTPSENAQIETLQKSLLENHQKLINSVAMLGSKYNRLEALSDQLINENTRLNEIKSIKSDTDYARTTIDLKLEENALQYSLQVGSRIMQNSLFDFLR